MYARTLVVFAAALVAGYAHADAHGPGKSAVADSVVAGQRANLAANTEGKGFGPQSPRDLRTEDGDNPIDFSESPDYDEMNLCNIHFHEGAEHAGGEFTTYAGNGDGKGYGSGFVYNGDLSAANSALLRSPL